MKKSILLLLSFSFLLITCNISAQTIVQKLGGAITNFQITNNDRDLRVVSQAILRKSISSFNKQTNLDSQILVLEFISRRKIEERENIVYSLSNEGKKAKIIFYTANDTVLFEKEFSDKINLFESEKVGGTENKRFYFYTVNLEEYPIMLFDRTARIDFLSEREIETLKKKSK